MARLAGPSRRTRRRKATVAGWPYVRERGACARRTLGSTSRRFRKFPCHWPIPGVVDQWPLMSRRSDDEQELVELLLQGSLTPSEFEWARTALGSSGATSVTTDTNRSAAEPVGASAAGSATTRSIHSDAATADSHTQAEPLSTSPADPAAPRSRTHIPRRMWIVSGSLAIILGAAAAALAVPATPDEILELRSGQVVTRSEIRVPSSSERSTDLELLASGSEPFEVTWALRQRVNSLDVQLRAAPGEQLVAIWADERPSEIDSIQRLHLLVDGQPRFRGFNRTLGTGVVVASVSPDADLSLELVSETQSEALDLRGGSRALEALEPPTVPDEDSEETRSRAKDPDNSSPRNAMGWPTARVDDGRQSSSEAAAPSDDAPQPSPNDRQEASEDEGIQDPSTDDGPPEAEEAPPSPRVGASFEGHIGSGQDAVDFARFLTQHALEAVYLDVTVPHEGEVITRQNSSFYIDVDPGELHCPECAYFYSISFQGGEGPPATAYPEGANVRITGYFLADSNNPGTGDVVPNTLIGGGAVEHALER